jgi:hypothetical protein
MDEADLSDITEDFSDGSRFSGRKSKGQLVDVNTGTLRRDHLLVQRTPGVEFYIGLGSMAGRLLDFAFASNSDPDPFFANCEVIDEALQDGDLAKTRHLGAPDELAKISDPHLRRLALVETMIGKASPDDPDHPGWPAGTEGGRGGQFRPKDDSDEAKETTQQKLKRLEVRKEFRIAASAVLRLAVTAALNAVPGVGEVADVEELIELGRTAIELGNAEREVNAAIDFVKQGPYCLDDLRMSPDDQSFSSVDAFKKISLLSIELMKRFGNAKPGSEYHHIVEQGGANETKIPAGQLHSTENIIPLPKLLHELVSAEYSETRDEKTKQTVRRWQQTQSFDEQQKFGIETLQKLGILRSDC